MPCVICINRPATCLNHPTTCLTSHCRPVYGGGEDIVTHIATTLPPQPASLQPSTPILPPSPTPIPTPAPAPMPTCLSLPQLVYFVIVILFFVLFFWVFVFGGWDTDAHIVPTSRPVTATNTGGCVLDFDSDSCCSHNI